METLKYISLDNQTDKAELIVQFTGGGAAITIKKNASAQEVVYLLRELAHALENGVAQRSAAQPPLQPTADRAAIGIVFD